MRIYLLAILLVLSSCTQHKKFVRLKKTDALKSESASVRNTVKSESDLTEERLKSESENLKNSLTVKDLSSPKKDEWDTSKEKWEDTDFTKDGNTKEKTISTDTIPKNGLFQNKDGSISLYENSKEIVRAMVTRYNYFWEIRTLHINEKTLSGKEIQDSLNITPSTDADKKALEALLKKIQEKYLKTNGNTN